MRTKSYWLAIMVVVACSKKDSKPRQDCEDYARKFVDVSGADPSRRATVEQGARSSCENGRVTDEQIQCVQQASSPDKLRACMGLGPTEGTPPSSSETTLEVVGIEGPGLEAEGSMSRDHAQWWKQMKSNVGACNTPMAYPAAAFDVLVTYTPHDSVTTDASAAPTGLRRCLSRAFDEPRPDTFDVPIKFHVKVTPAAGGVAAPSKPAGTTHVELTQVSKGTSNLDPNALTPDQQEWFGVLKKNVAACATSHTQYPATGVVVLTFNPKGEVWVDTSGSPKNLRDCLEKAVTVKHPDSIKYGMSELTIEIGR